MQSIKYAILIVSFLLAGATADAQYNPYWQWAKADTVNKLTVSDGGSVLAVKNGKAFWGRMRSIARVVDNQGQGTWLMAEYDSTGKQLNATAISGKVALLDAQADAAGNWYVLGRFYDSAIFASGGLLTRPAPATNTDGDHFIVRFDAGTLTVNWVKIVGPFINVSAKAFTLDNTNLYVSADSLNGTIIRTMSLATGNITSSFKQTGGSTTSSIQLDAQGNIYLAGSCATDGIDFNGASEPTTNPDAYSYIVKYTHSGNHVWHYWTPDPFCFQRKLTLYKNTFLYYSGDLKNSFTLGGQFVHVPTNNAFDYLAARLDTSGHVFWVRQTDTAGGGHATMNAPYHAIVTPDTALVLFAEGSGFMYWSDTVTSSLGGVTAATLVSFGPDKVARWARTLYTDYTSNQHVATEGTDVWVSGNAYSNSASVALDTLILKVPARMYTPYLAKTRMIRPVPVPKGVNGVFGEQVNVYPIPAHDVLKIEGLDVECSLTLTDITGREVSTVHVARGTAAAIFDVSDLPRGVYILQLRSATGRAGRRILLQ